MFAVLAADTRYGRPVTPSTPHRIRATLRSALNAAVRDGLLRDNPTRFIELPKPRRPHAQVWTDARVQAAGELSGLSFAVGGAVVQLALLIIVLAVIRVRRTLTGQTISRSALTSARHTAALVRRLAAATITALLAYALVRTILGGPLEPTDRRTHQHPAVGRRHRRPPTPCRL